MFIEIILFFGLEAVAVFIVEYISITPRRGINGFVAGNAIAHSVTLFIVSGVLGMIPVMSVRLCAVGFYVAT
jgi:hypothetical protein